MRKDAVGRGDVVWEEYKERNEIEGLGDMKLSGYVAVYREDMAMVMALVKFLVYNVYVILSYFSLISYFCRSCPGFWNTSPFLLTRKAFFEKI